jgi:hypothetical protein
MPLYAPSRYSVLEKTLVLEVETHEKSFIPGRSGWVVRGVYCILMGVFAHVTVRKLFSCRLMDGVELRERS